MCSDPKLMLRSDDAHADHEPAHESPPTVLLVEDDPAYARLIEEALETVDRPARLRVVTDGFPVIALARGDETPVPEPDLVLLDWHLPRVDGGDVLEALNDSEDCGSIPVVVLTNSRDPAHIRRAYQLDANAYVPKPDDLDELIATVRSILRFWL